MQPMSSESARDTETQVLPGTISPWPTLRLVLGPCWTLPFLSLKSQMVSSWGNKERIYSDTELPIDYNLRSLLWDRGLVLALTQTVHSHGRSNLISSKSSLLGNVKSDSEYIQSWQIIFSDFMLPLCCLFQHLIALFARDFIESLFI